MAVRKVPRKPPASALPSSPPKADLALDEEVTKGDIEQRRMIRAMLFTRSPREIIFQMREQFGLSYQQTRRLIASVRDENASQVALAQKTGRGDQILELRDLAGQMMADLARAKSDENRILKRAQEMKERGEKGPFPVYVPRRHIPSHREILACHDLIARVEGNFAPTKHVVAAGNVSTEILDLLGVSSPEEVAEIVSRGRKVIETDGQEVD